MKTGEVPTQDIHPAGPKARVHLIQMFITKLRPFHVLPTWARYGSTLLITAVFFGLHLLYDGHSFPFLFFFPPVILASLLFDRGSGLFATVLVTILAYFSVSQIKIYDVYNFGVLGGFFTICILIALVLEALRTSTHELNESLQDLMESNRKLADSNQGLDEFVHMVSHDLKEPVRGINNFSAFLLEDYGGRLGAGGRNQLETLKTIAMRMDRLIADLLRYSVVSKEEMVREETDLKETVSGVVELMRFQLEENHACVQVNDLPRVRCVKAHVEEIFRNLIANGIKYNESAAKKIEIGYMTNHGRHPGGIVFYVRDNGIGIADNEREAIFDMFKRLHGKEEYGGGTGSGLAIVKKLIERHGGEIWVDSRENEGSTFYFYLPRES